MAFPGSICHICEKNFPQAHTPEKIPTCLRSLFLASNLPFKGQISPTKIHISGSDHFSKQNEKYSSIQWNVAVHQGITLLNNGVNLGDNYVSKLLLFDIIPRYTQNVSLMFPFSDRNCSLCEQSCKHAIKQSYEKPNVFIQGQDGKG